MLKLWLPGVVEGIGRDFARAPSQPKPVEGAAQPIGQPAVLLKIDLVTSRGLALHLLARDRDGGSPAGKLTLTFG